MKIFLILILFLSIFSIPSFSQDSGSIPEFYGYIGSETSTAITNDGKLLNDFINENSGKKVKLTVFLDKSQTEKFIENNSFIVFNDNIRKYPWVSYRISIDDGLYYTYDSEVNSIEGFFIVEDFLLMRSLNVTSTLKSVN